MWLSGPDEAQRNPGSHHGDPGFRPCIRATGMFQGFSLRLCAKMVFLKSTTLFQAWLFHSSPVSRVQTSQLMFLNFATERAPRFFRLEDSARAFAISSLVAS